MNTLGQIHISRRGLQRRVEDIHGVFGTNWADIEYGEAELHGEDEVGGIYGVGCVKDSGDCL